MDKKTITPNLQQPVERKPAGQLPSLLAELDEAALSSPEASIPSNVWIYGPIADQYCDIYCSYNGDDE